MNVNPSVLIDSLFRSFPSMSLSQQLMMIIAVVRAVEKNVDIDVGAIIAKAKELELQIHINVELYLRGEIDTITMPEELSHLYEIENKFLAKIFAMYLKPSKTGVEKYL